MPHQCLKCGTVFEEGSAQLLKGCPDCGGNRFFFTKEALNEKQRTEIIKDGILQTYLHNTSSAKKYKTKTTANAGLIAPYPINIILQQGNQNKEEIIKEMKSGIYITNVWYTRFQNYMSGDFSTIPRDGIFLIQNGNIVKSIKDIRISDNLQRILENVINISNKPEWIIWWGLDFQIPIFTPYVLVKDVNITQSTM